MTRRSELNERSPIRVLDHSLHGGLERGSLGVVCAAAGVGKSAFLVDLALDGLMRSKKVLHVALEEPVERVRNYYDEIFAELARSEDLQDATEVRLLMQKELRIQAYLGATFSVDALERALYFLEGQAGMTPDLIVVDGYDWTGGSRDEVRELKRLARQEQAVLWMSASMGADAPPPTHPRSYPDPVAEYESLMDVLVQLSASRDTVHLQLLKDHDDPEPKPIPLDLDPTTLLLVRL